MGKANNETVVSILENATYFSTSVGSHESKNALIAIYASNVVIVLKKKLSSIR